MLQVAQNQDLLTEQLIARLLEDDLQDMENARAAEALQLSETFRVSALAAGRFPKNVQAVKTDPSDEDLAMEVLAAEIIASKDALIAQELQHAEESDLTASRQYAQKLAAAERKCALDAEFAKRLQDAFDDGNDDLNMDAESVLGQHTIEDIMASDLNDKGKGKGKGKGNVSVKMEVDHHAPPPSYMETIKREDSCSTLYPICGICMEPFQVTHSPVAAARSANSSSRLQFGTRLPCPRSHAYCISCLNGYIHSKLDPDGTGMVNQTAVIFPIRCPECSIAEWPEGIPDEVAGRVLSEKGMVLWHSQKLLDSGPRHYCPNPRCSALVQIDEESEDPQAVCPACSSLICVPCRVLWHTDLNCEEYQALPLDDRSPEDQDALRLIKAENWRRCPNCSFIVELTHGCNHITCRCKTEFCFKCGSLWDVRNKQCSREPSCELWDETMLLEERERERERAGAYRGIQPVAPPARHAAPARPVAPRRRGQSLDWMDDPDILCMRHWVTRDMISSLTCVYCDAKLNSLADLRYHLAHVRRHAVYACCGRFFKREEDFDRHVESEPVRFGFHLHTFQRD
ncbi:hypothetical protein PYCCODRAFT_1455722 [Trametes coccinea BRFM310]|uniref:RBR-type E3 ubiquitin transferase n=1 Tax=Trametes coccinea (strain BRFM310) TaxID=1353009 RepID=A0A1Y2J5U7_TRAC3|nr:hypothetical protein PYCCODRAFT_1455722 [Trametes coccinea BRFM310]